jgi:ADP-ribose pyrophosphatase
MSDGRTPGDRSGPAGKVGGERRFTGRVIGVDVDRVRFPDGSIGELEMVRHPGASAIVPLLGEPPGRDPEMLLIRQFRYAAERFIYEVPAGRLERDEAPEDCARRELREETGCTAERLEHVFTMYTTPGFTDERIHVFVASGITRGAHAREGDEFIEIVTVPLSRALEMIERNEIVDAKTALSILYVATFRRPD